MKVRPSVKPICEKCKIIKRNARTRSTSRSRAEQPKPAPAYAACGFFVLVSESGKERKGDKGRNDYVPT